MKDDSNHVIFTDQKNCSEESSMPDMERRRILSKIGVAAVVVPLVTLVTDATQNVAAAS